ncbi:MAG: MarR family transcriptional regulator [Planctomycetales bacterium]
MAIHDTNSSIDGPVPERPDGPANDALQAVVRDLQRAAALLRSLSAARLAEFDLNPVRRGVLEILDECAEGCSQTELAERLRQSESGVSTLVDRMRRSELVYRLRSKADRRKRLLMLAPRGRELLGLVRQRRADPADTLLRCFDAREIRELAGLLERLVKALADTRADRPQNDRQAVAA